MNDSNNKEKVKKHIVLSKSQKDSFSKSLPNIQFTNGISIGLTDALKPLADYNLSVVKAYSTEILNTQKKD